jgi:hypothetical protein
MAGMLALFGKADQIAGRSDLLFSAAVLFADGWWKVRKVFSFSKEALEFSGFVGAVVAIFFATISLLNELSGIQQLATITSSQAFVYSQIAIEATAIIYALIVRSKVFEDEEFRRDTFLELSRKVKKYEGKTDN